MAGSEAATGGRAHASHVYLFSVVVVASLCRGAQRVATGTATQRRGYNPTHVGDLCAQLSDNAKHLPSRSFGVADSEAATGTAVLRRFSILRR